ncbi:vWA domain-containing protein [Deinococcus sp. JMULE3]|uniref:vWA domain-containing protein n=1 Tax=Deinococcus sp. JMULE3 TaxID=2518341 RepID=UPI001577593D|nr:vWA domain-containing protein [Deinococcus sp. JMULE3]NTY01800.1 VWA domain-containing protein [Deinococcus sp. JMULE3]
MPRTALLPLLLLASAGAAQDASCSLPSGDLPTRTRVVFVLDTSGSMRGIGDGRADIFDRVRGQLNAFVRAAQPDRAELITFDSGLRSRRTFDAPAGSPAWNAALGTLQADGRNTFLYRSVRDALRPLTAQGGEVTQVFVLTDGIDNDTREQGKTVTAEGALNAWTGRGPLDRLTYVALGADIPAEARAALSASTYASGLTVPVNVVPDLGGAGLEGGLRRVTGDALPAPFPDGTPVTLASGTPGLSLTTESVQGGELRLTVPAGLRPGTPALLCAPPVAGAAWIAPRERQVLLRLTGQPLTWLNPGADLALRGGEDVVLRLRAAPGVNTARITLGALPAGVTGRVDAPAGSRDFTVTLRAARPLPDLTVTPTLLLPEVGTVPLPTLRGQAGGRTLTVPATTTVKPPAPTPAPSPRPSPSPAGRWAWLALLPLLALGIWAALRRRPAAKPAPRAAPARPFLPGVEGLEYREDRTLHLVTADGEVAGVPTPLGGPFDLGQLSRVPHLSGLRAEQHRDGLKLLRLPPDLDVSQGARLLQAGDIVRPGTLIGVAVARQVRAPRPDLGDLAGLGLPLALHVTGAHMQVRGPYGAHALRVTAPVTDLGQVLRAPALDGLRLSLSGGVLLLLAAPDGVTLRAAGDTTPLRESQPLPPHVVLDFLPSATTT